MAKYKRFKRQGTISAVQHDIFLEPTIVSFSQHQEKPSIWTGLLQLLKYIRASPKISIPMENNFSFVCPEIMGSYLEQFFDSVKTHGNPPIECFQFWNSYSVYFFLGPGGDKAATFNALW